MKACYTFCLRYRCKFKSRQVMTWMKQQQWLKMKEWKLTNIQNHLNKSISIESKVWHYFEIYFNLIAKYLKSPEQVRFNVVPSDPFTTIFVPFNLTFFNQNLMTLNLKKGCIRPLSSLSKESTQERFLAGQRRRGRSRCRCPFIQHAGCGVL